MTDDAIPRTGTDDRAVRPFTVGFPPEAVDDMRRRVAASCQTSATATRHRLSCPNQWSLSGDWRVGVEPAVPSEPGEAISYRFHARDLHLVMGLPVARPPVRFTVHLDGEPPRHTHGIDIDETGHGTSDYQRMYQLIRQPPPIGDRLFEIEFLDAGVEAHVFTFG